MTKRWRHLLEYAALRILRTLLLRLNYHLLSDIGSAIGRMAGGLGIRRSVARDNILLSDLGLSTAIASALLRKSYSNLGRTFVELLCLDRIHPEREFTLVADPDYFLLSARGAVVVSMHLGNWELLAKTLISHGVRLAVVVKRQSNPKVDALINTIRQRAGYTIVYDDDARSMIGLLSKGYALGLMADQDFGENPVATMFLGRSCRTARGPEYFVQRYLVPLFLAYGIRVGKYRHEFHLERLTVSDPVDREGGISRLFSARMEELVRQYPDQWLWHHRRWKNPA